MAKHSTLGRDFSLDLFLGGAFVASAKLALTYYSPIAPSPPTLGMFVVPTSLPLLAALSEQDWGHLLFGFPKGESDFCNVPRAYPSSLKTLWSS